MNTNHFQSSFKIITSLVNIHEVNFTKAVTKLRHKNMAIYSYASGRKGNFSFLKMQKLGSMEMFPK